MVAGKPHFRGWLGSCPLPDPAQEVVLCFPDVSGDPEVKGFGISIFIFWMDWEGFVYYHPSCVRCVFISTFTDWCKGRTHFRTSVITVITTSFDAQIWLGLDFKGCSWHADDWDWISKVASAAASPHRPSSFFSLWWRGFHLLWSSRRLVIFRFFHMRLQAWDGDHVSWGGHVLCD